MLTAYRRSVGITQVQVAQHMGVTQSTVSDIESGEIANPGLNTLMRYADALGTRIVWGIAGINGDRIWR
jgi:transcriptional regulator with XRE-family HTH domain